MKPGSRRRDFAAVGITNQRETAIVWDRRTGRPVHNAIVWQDTRTQPLIDRLAADGGADRFASSTGLPLATYFSASKIAWILENVPGARADAEAGHLLFGTPDTWLIWNLTGDTRGGIHVTDVTNASRTLLMDLETLAWSDELLEVFGIPRSMLPEIVPSSGVVGEVHEPPAARGIPIAGILGDQQAATFGQAAFESGQSKNTYGTGNFLLVNTGTEIVRSQHGLVTTVAYRCGDEPAHYALEGSIAVTGSLVQWLRDNLGIISSASEVVAAGRHGRRQRRRVLRARLLGAVRPVLAARRPRRPRGADPVRQPGAHRARGDRGGRVPVARRDRRDRGRHRARAHRAARGRRRIPRRHDDAVPGRHPRHPGRAPGDHRDHRPRRRVRGGARDRGVAGPRRRCAPSGAKAGDGSRRCPRTRPTGGCACGARPSPSRSTGSTTTSPRCRDRRCRDRRCDAT